MEKHMSKKALICMICDKNYRYASQPMGHKENTHDSEKKANQPYAISVGCW